MTFPLYTYTQKTPQQVHDDYLRTVRNGLISTGLVANPNTGPNSDYDKTAWALANEIAVVQANGVIMADQLMPDTAAGTFLDRWLTLLNLTRNPAIGSHGVVTIGLNVPSTLITNLQQLIDTAGLRYQVQTGGAYANQSQVPIYAIDTGTATNHNNGDTLSWVNGPPYAAPTVTVGTPGATNGLIDGADSEIGTDEPPRNRLFNAIQHPPLGGNWAQVSAWAAAASPGSVGLASVYPALLGPSTVFFAVSAPVNLTNPGGFVGNSFSRAVPAVLVSGTILPYVQGQLPEGVYAGGLSTVDLPCDVAMVLSLPSAPTAQPPGPGGGWLDAAPWPPSNGTDGVRITSITTPTIVTVNATTTNGPSPGATHVSWVNPATWEIVDSIVLAVSGGSGAWVLTLSVPLPGVVTNGYIFPTSLNEATYLLAFLGAVATMGPGEWSSNPTVLQRGFRHPIPGQVAPSAMAATQLSAVIRSANEVADAVYVYRSYVTPPVPALPVGTTAPNILIPANIGFYAQ